MRWIHLLYVPTMACNMACRYCYLGDSAVDGGSPRGALETLQYAVNKLRQADVMPFNISLHGGEVTTLAPEVFRELVAYIHTYYHDNARAISDAGFRVGAPHIKTNLYGLDRHIDAIREYGVSVSGSLDLPFSLHDAYRVDRAGRPTREKILRNVALLASLPNRKKVSATLFHEHILRTEEIISDIRFLHEHTCLDMNDFNFMIGFESAPGGLLTAMTEEEQVAFYRRMREAFQGTELQRGLDKAWFAEFGPGYCTNCDNCGEKFFLLERNGDVYSCVRGQGRGDFRYGNIFEDAVPDILEKARTQILAAHRRVGFDEACAKCGYLYLCKTGCPFVKDLYGSPRSYTCQLQKELYADSGMGPDPENAFTVYGYLEKTHPELAEAHVPPRIPRGVPPLQEIIAADPKLKYIYDPDAFVLNVDGQDFPLQSQILRACRDTVCITAESTVRIYLRKEVMAADCDYPQNNALYIQMLSGNMIVYGDEGRLKQRHVMNEMVYLGILEETPCDRTGWYALDITHIFRRYGRSLCKTEANNLFFTTSALRDAHYAKQKNNAFYHMQAMDLPFQNIEFYYLDLADWEAFPDAAPNDL